MAGLIARHAPSDAVVVSLQNGVGNLDVAARASWRPAAPGRRHGALQRRADAHRWRSASLPSRHQRHAADRRPACPACATRSTCRASRVAEHSDMDGVLWGKLVLNLNNALNALCDLPLAQELADGAGDCLLAAQIEEALAVLKATGIAPAGVEGVPPRAIPLHPAAARLAVPAGGAAHAGDRSRRALLHVGGSGAAPADRDRLSAGRHPGAGRQVGRGGADHRARRCVSSRVRRARAPARRSCARARWRGV